MQLVKEMCERKITVSMGEARRLICQGVVTVNDKKVTDMSAEINADDEISIKRNK